MRKNRAFYYLLPFLMGWTFAVRAAGESRRLTYRETVAGKVTHYTFEITARGDGYSLNCVYRETDCREEFLTDRDLSVLRWAYHDPAQASDFLACRRGGVIELSGRFRGKPVSKKYDGVVGPWKQKFPLGLEDLALGRERQLVYAAVDPHGLSLHLFCATAQAGDGREAHLRITLTGLLAPLWHADSWHRPGDGLFVRFACPMGPGAPLTVTELIEEAQ